jgi:hypothetical protein
MLYIQGIFVRNKKRENIYVRKMRDKEMKCGKQEGKKKT